MEIKRGAVLRDNDPRNKGRMVIVTRVEADRVVYASKTRTCHISKARIFTDGKKRAQGWNVVSPAEAHGSFGKQGEPYKVGDKVRAADGTVRECVKIETGNTVAEGHDALNAVK